jgi:hypothetical protein
MKTTKAKGIRKTDDLTASGPSPKGGISLSMEVRGDQQRAAPAGNGLKNASRQQCLPLLMPLSSKE